MSTPAGDGVACVRSNPGDTAAPAAPSACTRIAGITLGGTSHHGNPAGNTCLVRAFRGVGGSDCGGKGEGGGVSMVQTLHGCGASDLHKWMACVLRNGAPRWDMCHYDGDTLAARFPDALEAIDWRMPVILTTWVWPTSVAPEQRTFATAAGALVWHEAQPARSRLVFVPAPALLRDGGVLLKACIWQLAMLPATPWGRRTAAALDLRVGGFLASCLWFSEDFPMRSPAEEQAAVYTQQEMLARAVPTDQVPTAVALAWARLVAARPWFISPQPMALTMALPTQAETQPLQPTPHSKPLLRATSTTSLSSSDASSSDASSSDVSSSDSAETRAAERTWVSAHIRAPVHSPRTSARANTSIAGAHAQQSELELCEPEPHRQEPQPPATPRTPMTPLPLVIPVPHIPDYIRALSHVEDAEATMVAQRRAFAALAPDAGLGYLLPVISTLTGTEMMWHACHAHARVFVAQAAGSAAAAAEEAALVALTLTEAQLERDGVLLHLYGSSGFGPSLLTPMAVVASQRPWTACRDMVLDA